MCVCLRYRFCIAQKLHPKITQIACKNEKFNHTPFSISINLAELLCLRSNSKNIKPASYVTVLWRVFIQPALSFVTTSALCNGRSDLDTIYPTKRVDFSIWIQVSYPVLLRLKNNLMDFFQRKC